jgi:glutathione S-transferase
MNRGLDIGLSLAASLAAGGRGVKVTGDLKQPAQLLALYDIENCPYCRIVREALTALDLDAEIYPCPKGGTRHRQLVQKRGGKSQFPFLVDPNTKTQLYESADIVNYLSATYGDGRRRGPLRRALTTASAHGASALRLPRGARSAGAAALPTQMLELYSFEASPFARFVREYLCEREIPYILRNCGRRQGLDWLPIPPLRARLAPGYAPVQRNRQFLSEVAGKVQVPCLVDPNTGVTLFESADIVAYLDHRYA